MTDIKLKFSPLAIAAAIGLLAVCGSLSALLLTVRAEVPRYRALLDRQISTQGDLTRQSLAAGLAHAEAGATGQLAALRGDLRAQGDAYRATLTTALSGAAAQIDVIHSELRPTLTAIPPIIAQAQATMARAESAVKDGQDMADTLWPDVEGSVASATVAITSIAQASEEVRKAAPSMAISVVGIAKDADDIAGDAKREADLLLAPKTTWQKIEDGLKFTALVAHYLW